MRATLDAMEDGEEVGETTTLYVVDSRGAVEVLDALEKDSPAPEEPPLEPPVELGAEIRTVRLRPWQLAAIAGGAALLGLLIGRAATPKRIVTATAPAQAGLGSPASTSPNPLTSSAPAAAGAPVAKAPSATAVPAPPPGGPRLLLDLRRETGPKTTQHFLLTGGRWVLGWAYDCSGRGGEGAFQVTIYTPDGLPSTEGGVNQRGAKGSSIAAYTSTGERYLGVQTNCVWAIRVTTA